MDPIPTAAAKPGLFTLPPPPPPPPPPPLLPAPGPLRAAILRGEFAREPWREDAREPCRLPTGVDTTTERYGTAFAVPPAPPPPPPPPPYDRSLEDEYDGVPGG